MEATDWLDATVERAKKKYQVQRALDKRSVQAEAMKRKLGNQFCRELFAWFESIEVRFSSRFGSQVLAVSVVGSDGMVAALYSETVLNEELVMVHEWGVKGERNEKLYLTVTSIVLPGAQGGNVKAWLGGQHEAVTVTALGSSPTALLST